MTGVIPTRKACINGDSKMAESLARKDKETKAIFRKRSKRLVARNTASSSIIEFYRVHSEKDQEKSKH